MREQRHVPKPLVMTSVALWRCEACVLPLEVVIRSEGRRDRVLSLFLSILGRVGTECLSRPEKVETQATTSLAYGVGRILSLSSSFSLNWLYRCDHAV
jgi:hypothetical protein